MEMNATREYFRSCFLTLRGKRSAQILLGQLLTSTISQKKGKQQKCPFCSSGLSLSHILLLCVELRDQRKNALLMNKHGSGTTTLSTFRKNTKTFCDFIEAAESKLSILCHRYGTEDFMVAPQQ